MESTGWMYDAEGKEIMFSKCDFLMNADAKFQERVKNNEQQVRESIKMLGANQQDSITKLGSTYKYMTQADQEFIEDKIRKYTGFGPAACKAIAKALELALKYDLPIDSYWIHYSKEVKVMVLINEHNILLLFFTPGPRDK